VILLDTNVVSEILRPSELRAARVVHWFAENGRLPIYLSSVSEAELWLGVYTLPHGKRRSGLETAIGQMLTEDFSGRIVPFESRAALAYGKLFGKRQALGRPISHEDCQIAAVAQVHGFRLATRNAIDFEDCGLSVVDPWQA
jgi:toxin FitB